MSAPRAIELPVQRRGIGASGRPVLLLHGLGGAAGTWWRVADGLAAAGFPVCAPDLRGHGRAAFTSQYRLADYHADLAALGSDWALIIGQSLGGLLALHLGLPDPGRARALLLLDPVLEVPDDRYEVVTRAQLRAVDRPAEPRQIQQQNPGWHPGDIRAAAEAARGLSPWVVEQTMVQNRPWHHLHRLGELRVRTHIIGADPEHGAVIRERAVAAYLSRQLSFETATGSGHAVYRDAAELVFRRALELLAG